jgi:hypothetical protein
MIIYGSNETKIGKEDVFDACTNCGSTNSIELTVFQKYAHVFWIPFFPLQKTGESLCTNCHQVIRKKHFPSYLKSSFDNLKSRSRAPIWTFSGLAILALLIGWIIYDDHQSDLKNAQLINNAQPGDVYEIKLGYKNYTLYKVSKVVGDTVFFWISKYQANKVTSLSAASTIGDEIYQKEPIPKMKIELQTMLDADAIVDIERK